jgi:hypothetical protein
MAEKKKITGQFAPRYRKADKAGKTTILNEYLALVGGNRKHAIFKLGREGTLQLRLIDGKYVNVRVSGGTRRKRAYARYYDDEVKTVIIKLWAFFCRICGERLTPLIKANLDALCRRSPCAALIQTAAGSSLTGISRTGVNAAASPSPGAVPIIPTTTASSNRKTLIIVA